MRGRLALVGALVLFVALGAVGIILDLERPEDLVGNLIFSTWLIALILVGALVVWRRPHHAVGWLFVSASVIMAISLTSKSYALAAYADGRDLPAPGFAAWLSSWAPLPAAGLLLLAMILFPDGRLPSSRWRRSLPILAGAFVLATIGPMFRPGPIDGLPSVDNPYGTAWGDLIWDVSQIAQPIAAGAVFCLVASLILRSRRADLVERQQIKWVAYSLGALPLAFIVSQVVQTFDDSPEEVLGFLIIMAGLLAVPAAIGMAILRYRLFEIDLVVNRTIVYLVLSAILGLVYVGGIALIQSVLPLAADNQLAVAASTLAVAGLFRPLRRRVQGFIDHYFYRRKYDAQRTIDEFSTKLRDEIDLDTLNHELVGVVSRTMQPTHVSIWVPAHEVETS